MLSKKTTLLLDMNGTFMFGEDRFGESENFSLHYHQIGGALPTHHINSIVKSAYAYLDLRYPDPAYRIKFPSVENAIKNVTTIELSNEEISKIVDTFAFHEIGIIPEEYVNALHKLHKIFQLAVVIDIWSPKSTWLTLFNESRITRLFSASSFSSDHGIVKPSPETYERIVAQLGIDKDQCLIIGDSVRRDLGGAKAAGIDCVLVGGAHHSDALWSYENLLEFSDIQLCKNK